MAWLIDLILVSCIVISAVKHFKDGFMSSVYRVACLFLSVLFAIAFCKPLAGLLASGPVGNSIRDYVYGKTVEFVGENEIFSSFFQNIPDGFSDFLKLFGRDIDVLSENFHSKVVNENVLREMADFISEPIVNTLSTIIAYVLIFAVSFIGLSVAAFFLKKIKLPLIHAADKALGLVFGIIVGVIVASLLSTAVYSAISIISAVNNDLYALIDKFEEM